MANPEHVNIVAEGSEAINEWRSNHPDQFLRLECADFSGASLRKADLSMASLGGAVLRETDLQGADLSRADLSKANLREANLRKADLSEASMCEADLRGAFLTRANLNRANLACADLRGAILIATILSKANLSGANLDKADLSKADLRSTNLSNANLSGTNLTGTTFSAALLRGASFCNATFGRTILAAVDLMGVDLANVRHESPSSISLDTVVRSRGRIPKEFLRGAGIPELFITYIPSLIEGMSAIQFYSCFLSHSTADKAFADILHSKLQSYGVRTWYAPESMRGGRKQHEQIDHAIIVNDKFLLVLSEASIKSDWVKLELRWARRAERETGRQLLFPIRLCSMMSLREWHCFDSDDRRDLAAEVREYHIPDFSNWTDASSFDQAFADLLRDLREEDPPSLDRLINE